MAREYQTQGSNRVEGLEAGGFSGESGIRTFTLVSDNGSIQLEYYKSLSEAIADLSKR